MHESLKNAGAHHEISMKNISNQLAVMHSESQQHEYKLSMLQSDLKSRVHELSLCESELIMSQSVFLNTHEIADFIQRSQPTTTTLTGRFWSKTTHVAQDYFLGNYTDTQSNLTM